MSSDSAHELGNMATAKTLAAQPVVDEISDSDYKDNQQLARLGKKPVLKVRSTNIHTNGHFEHLIKMVQQQEAR